MTNCYHGNNGLGLSLIVTIKTVGVTDFYLGITGQKGWLIITMETCNICATFDENGQQPYQSGQSRLSQTRKSDSVTAWCIQSVSSWWMTALPPESRSLGSLTVLGMLSISHIICDFLVTTTQMSQQWSHRERQ